MTRKNGNAWKSKLSRHKEGKGTKKVDCPKCGHRFGIDLSIPIVTCPSCGLQGKI